MNRITTIVLRHWKPFLGLNTILFAIAVYTILSTPKVWTAKAALILPNSKSELKADLGTLGDLSGGDGVVFSQQLNPLKILSSIMTSDETLTQVWEQDSQQELFSRLKTYKSLFKVSPHSESTVISLSVEGSSPDVAKQRTNAWVEKFQKRLQQLRQADVATRTQLMSQELEQAQNNLQKTQTALAQYQQTTNLVSAKEQTAQLVTTIENLTTTQTQLIAQAQANATKVNSLSARLRMSPEQAMRSLQLGENSNYQFVRNELAEVEAQLVATRDSLHDNHPSVQSLLIQRQQLQSQLEQYISQATGGLGGVNRSLGSESAILVQQLIMAESEAQALRTQAEQIQLNVIQLNAQLNYLPVAQQKLVELQRQYEIAEGVYNGLVAKVQEVKLNAFSAYPSVQLLDQPHVDFKPTEPKKRLIALGTLLTSFFGSMALILWLESRNPVLIPEDLEPQNIPLLATIPYCKNYNYQLDSLKKAKIEFQRLASAVITMSLPHRRLLISSATAGEGKTTVTLGLAKALINMGFRVLVVDGDLYRNRLSQSLSYSQTVQIHPHLMAVRVEPQLDLLSLIPKGEKIIEFIASGDFERYLRIVQAKGNYDYVLMDSAPIASTSETTLMLKAIPDILFVVYPGFSDRNPVYRSLEQVKLYQARIVGLVLNGVARKNERYLYQYQGHFLGSDQ